MIPPMLLVGVIVGSFRHRWNDRRVDAGVLAITSVTWGAIVALGSVWTFLVGTAFAAINFGVAYVAGLPWSTRSRKRGDGSTRTQPSTRT